jgi:hypothetical protein
MRGVGACFATSSSPQWWVSRLAKVADALQRPIVYEN